MPKASLRAIKPVSFAELKIVKNAGHFNEKAGYKQFPLLLEDIKCAV